MFDYDVQGLQRRGCSAGVAAAAVATSKFEVHYAFVNVSFCSIMPVWISFATSSSTRSIRNIDDFDIKIGTDLVARQNI